MLIDIVKEYGFTLGVELVVAAVFLALMFSVIRETRAGNAESEHMFWLTLSNFCYIAFDVLCYFFSPFPYLYGYYKLAVIVSNCAMEAALLVFNFALLNSLRKKTYVDEGVLYFAGVMTGIPVILCVVRVLTESTLIEELASGETKMLGLNTTSICYVIMLVFDAALVISCRRVLTGKEMGTWLLYIVFPFLAMLTGTDSIIAISEMLAVFTLYMNIHVEQARDLAQAGKLLSESKAQLMVSQIQPHFMYNSLNSIYYLIEKEPALAQEAVSTFSGYLRQNIKSIKDNNLIPVEEELNHTKAYLYLEMLRFGDKIRVEYDIRETSFRLPPLTIQPLVENSIKHGLTVKPEGGTVRISTYRDEDHYHVVIQDDGAGFASGNFHDENSTHIGLFNVHARLRDMCSGTLTVESEVGKGTVCRIDIPLDSIRATIKKKKGEKVQPLERTIKSV